MGNSTHSHWTATYPKGVICILYCNTIIICCIEYLQCNTHLLLITIILSMKVVSLLILLFPSSWTASHCKQNDIIHQKHHHQLLTCCSDGHTPLWRMYSISVSSFYLQDCQLHYTFQTFQAFSWAGEHGIPHM